MNNPLTGGKYSRLLIIVCLAISREKVYGVQYKASEASFPYQFWKPATQAVTKQSRTPTPHQKHYGHFYGKPLSDLLGSPSESHADPISIPNDLVKDQSKWGSNPFDPDSFAQGQRSYNQRKFKKSYYPTYPHRHRFSHNNSPKYSSNNFHYKQTKRNYRPSEDDPWKKSNPIYTKNYNAKTIQPHIFYPITESQNVSIKILEKDHRPKVPLRPKAIQNSQKEFQPSQKFDPLNYNRYMSQGVHNLHLTKRRYNENLIDLIRQKFDLGRRRENRYIDHRNYENNYISSPNIFTDSYIKDYKPPPKRNFAPPYETPNYSFMDKYIKEDDTSPYDYKSYRQPQNRRDHYYDDSYSQNRPYQPSYHYKKYKPAINAYPKERTRPKYDDKGKHLLYYYHNNDEDYDYIEYSAEDKKESIIERIASIQSAPSTLLIPGGLAALGFGLALYYFNNVWYPTPVVTARLSKIISNFINNYFEEDGSRELGQVMEVFRSLENHLIYETDNCKNLVVCQLHEDFPSLWNVTQLISPSFSFAAPDKKILDGYLQTAKEGALRGETPCKERHKKCPKSLFEFRPLINSIFQDPTDGQIHGESRVL